MADVRSVVVRLSAETSSYIAKMQQAGAVTETSMSKSEKAAHKASVGLTDVEKAGAAGAVALAGMALVASADFEQAMSSVEAATHGTAAEMGSLEQAALDAGKATSFSATEAAAGIENLAKAGVSTADILGGALTGSLDLAAAGQISVADAAEYTATALTQFQLDGSEAAHVADLLAAGAGKAQGEVSDMALALNYAGVPAANLGVSIEETAGSIALLAKNGIVGEKAGTALRGMLGSLGSPSKIAAKEMENLGINVFDAKGNFIGFNGVAGQLQEKLAGLTQQEREQALGRIFGNEQAAAAGVFFREGAAGVDEMTKAVNDEGYAAETASIKMDNLKGDVEVLMGSIETALIGSGDSSQDQLRTTTQLLTEMVDAMSAVQEQSAIGGATDQLSFINSDGVQTGLAVLQKTKFELFGVDKATKDAAEATEKKTKADELAAAEATRLASATQVSAEVTEQSTEELKAQADALEDARKAAHDTASSFFNLGDSVGDAKVSLGDWIHDMEQSANALKNFRLNAKEAADDGLRRGLIDALREAGPEGAMRMRQLANATQGEIDRANKAWQSGQSEIGKYVNATTRVPKDVSSSLRIDGVEGALASLAKAQQALTELDKRDVEAIARITTVYKSVGNATDALPDKTPRPAGADGMTVPGQRTPYGDKTLIWAAPGEEVITNRNGEADAFRADRAAGRIPGYADGGQVGGKDGKPDKNRGPQAVARPEGGMAEWLKEQTRLAEKMSKAADKGLDAAEKNLDAAQGLLDSAQSLLDTTTAQRDSFASTVAGNFNNDPFGNGLAGAMTQLNADANDAGTLDALLQSLAGAGLDGAAFEGLAASGDINTAQQLAAGGPASIAALEAAFAGRTAAQSSLSGFAADQQYGAQLAAQTAEVQKQTAAVQGHTAAVQVQTTVNRQIEQRLSMLEAAVERGAEKGTRAGNNDRDQDTKLRGKAGR